MTRASPRSAHAARGATARSGRTAASQIAMGTASQASAMPRVSVAMPAASPSPSHAAGPGSGRRPWSTLKSQTLVMRSAANTASLITKLLKKTSSGQAANNAAAKRPARRSASRRPTPKTSAVVSTPKSGFKSLPESRLPSVIR